jgi:hypothetical protein
MLNRRIRGVTFAAGVVAVGALAALAFLLSPASLYAQSCAMCYQNAAASGPRLITALKNGILVLMFPPLLIFCGILGLAFRRRDSFALEAQPETDAPPLECNEIEIPLYD